MKSLLFVAAILSAAQVSASDPLTEINARREAAGLAPVQVSAALMAVAESHADAPAETGRLDMRSVRIVADEVGYPSPIYPTIAELTPGASLSWTLAQNRGTRAAMLADSATDIGWAKSRSSRGNVWWTVLFGTGEFPQAKTVAASQGSAQIGSAITDEAGRSEVIRRGDMVEHVGSDERFATQEDALIAQIASPPKADNEKWYLSVWASKTCQPCKELKELWKTDPTLRAYAQPENPKESWAHYTWYWKEDKYQEWRLRKTPQNPNPIVIDRVPTIIVQPPRLKAADGSWKYGDPTTVVLKYVWEGSPDKMRQAINSAIEQYVSTLQKREGGLHEEVPPALGFGAIASDDQDMIPQGFGQVEVPPLPLNDKPDPDSTRREIRSGKRQILIILDDELRTTDSQQTAIDETIAALQENPPLPVREVSIEKCPRSVKSQVKLEDLPAVLLVEGSDLIEKRLPRPDAGFFGGPLGALWKLAGTGITIIGTAISAFCSLGIFLAVIVLGVKTLQWAEILPKPLWNRTVAAAPTPQPVPAPDNSSTPDPALVAAVAAAVKSQSAPATTTTTP